MVRDQDVRRPRKISDFKVAFTLNGNMCDNVYPYMFDKPNDYVWEDNQIFNDALEYESYYSSSSGNSRILFKSIKTNRTYAMFMSDFDEVLQAKKFMNNQIIGKFCFCKKNSAQGVRFLLNMP